MKLSNILKEILDEAARELTPDLALFIEGTTIALYRPTASLKSAMNKLDADEDNENIKNAIIGVLTLRFNDKYKSYEVDSINAQKGYGPLLYKLGMNLAAQDGLIANRTGQITPEAKKVWKEFFDGIGSAQVNKVKVDDRFHPNEDYLNFKYTLKIPINTLSAISKHKRFIGNDPHEEKKTFLWELFDSFLRGKIQDIYQN